MKPDGAPDEAIKITPNGSMFGTIMGAYGSTSLKETHFWPIAIDSQELLREKLGRKVKCSIEV